MSLTPSPGVPGGRGPILAAIADDGLRAEVCAALGEGYDVAEIASGEAALEALQTRKAAPHLVLLDPALTCGGKPLLPLLRESCGARPLPVIAVTRDAGAGGKALRDGADDLILLPGDPAEAVRARVDRALEDRETAAVIRTAERDDLTGLYNRDFFYRYVAEFDRDNGVAADAVLVDVGHFTLAEELLGQEGGRELIAALAAEIRAFIRENEGLACRKETDVFLLYLPHRESYDDLAARLKKILKDRVSNPRICIRVGVYPQADRRVSPSRRFRRAKVARETLRGGIRTVAIYNGDLHQKQLTAQRLLNEMESALAEGQFSLYFQPKFDITGDVPRLAGAETLIRWRHPELGLISPGVFIPLFEENRLIGKLDRYVWREAARLAAAWRDRFGTVTPISVNVSRLDLFDEDLVSHLLALVREFGIAPRDYHLEITESADTASVDQLVKVAELLHNAGFCLEMDDFGSGFSSLNLLAQMPVDVLKLDIGLIRRLGTNEKTMHIMQLIMEIKNYLSIPVVAEGVETKEQLAILRQMGCETAQGYYFSPPVPVDAFEKLLEENVRSC